MTSEGAIPVSTPDMKAAGRPAPELRVGQWRVYPARNEIARGDESAKLEPKAVEVLAYLAARAGDVVGREELLAAIWPGVVVGDDALTQAIIKLRKALGDDAHRPRYIETISKRGYRLIAPVTGGGQPGPGTPRSSALPRRVWRVPAAAVAGGLLLAAIAYITIPQLSQLVPMPWPIAADARPGPASAAFPTVAVLPLSNLSGDPRRDYFSDGVTEDIIAALGRFSGIRVMSRNAVQGFKGKSPSPQTIRDELGARYIVQGSVREAGGKLRVAVELSDADKGALLWSERYDGEGTQLFEIQDRIATNIVGVLAVRLTRLEQQRVFTKPTESLEAHDLMLRARSLLERTDRGANREARALLARALRLAPDYPELKTGLGEAEFQRALYGWIEDVGSARTRAEALARDALASTDTRFHARAHALLASIYTTTRQMEPALHHAERALEVNASDAGALYRRGGALLYMGRLGEAIDSLETARRFEPYPGAIEGYNLALAYFVAGRYREALAQADAMLARAPEHVYLHAIRAATLSHLGTAQEARQAADQVRRFNPYFDASNLGIAFGNPEHTRKVQDGLRRAGL